MNLISKLTLGGTIIFVPLLGYGIYLLSESPENIESSEKQSQDTGESKQESPTPKLQSQQPQQSQTQEQTAKEPAKTPQADTQSQGAQTSEDKTQTKEEGKNKFLDYLTSGGDPQEAQKIKEFFKERFGDENIWRLYHSQWKKCGLSCTLGFSYPAVDWGVSNWLYEIGKHDLYYKINWDVPPKDFNVWTTQNST